MIFYFSGTGNSKYVAESMSDNKLVDISKANIDKNYSYEIEDNEKVGFIFPVYYSGLPKPVLDFVRKVNLPDEVDYLYCVLTHGGGPGGAGTMLERELKKRGYKLKACFDIKMPSNYIMFGDLKSEEEINKRLNEAPKLVEAVKQSVDNKVEILPKWSKIDRILTSSMKILCDRYMPVKKFYADDKCTGCGLCTKNCPSEVIKMVNGKPCWKENKCVRCMACLSCEHVQYGAGTQNRRRYKFKK